MDRRIFVLFAGGCVLGALYHAVAALMPELGIYGPRWRHGLFVGVDLFTAWYFLRRPLWLLPAYVALVVQQFNGHGRYLVTLWQAEHRIHWLALVSPIGLTFGLVLLGYDAWLRYRRAGVSQLRVPAA